MRKKHLGKRKEREDTEKGGKDYGQNVTRHGKITKQALQSVSKVSQRSETVY